MKNFNLISIIIPVRNEEATIERCMLVIERLNYPKDKIEIIVVDDGSTDRTLEILKKFKGVQIICAHGVGPSKARNIALQRSKGKFIAFTDGDCVVDRDWINELLKGFYSDDIVSVGGDQRAPENGSKFGRKVNHFLKTIGFLGGYTKWATSMVEVKHNPTCNSMYRREIFEKVGYFNEHLWPGEDMELDQRIRKKNLKIVYNPAAIVYHYRPSNIRGFVSMTYRYGKTSGGYLTREFGFYRNLSYEPVLLFIYLFVLFFLLVYKLWFGLGFLFACLFGVCFFFLSRRMRLSELLSGLILYPIALIFWNAGFIKGFFSCAKE